MAAGSVSASASILATSGTRGAAEGRSASALAIASAAGCIKAQWKGADTGSSMARRAPLAFAISVARSTASLAPETTTWPGALSFATSHTFPVAAAASAAAAAAAAGIEAEQSRHRAFARRDRFLHRLAAQPQQPRRIRDAEGARGAKRRIFAERMAGDESNVAAKIKPAFALQRLALPPSTRSSRRVERFG